MHNSQKALIDAGVSYVEREVLTVPNAITACRFVFAGMIFPYANDPMLVLQLAFAGAVSDALDGIVATLLNQHTRFGKRLDQWADFACAMAVIYALYVQEGLTERSTPLFASIGTYLVIRLFYPTAETNSPARIKTFLQYVGTVLILTGNAFVSPPLATAGYVALYVSLPHTAIALWSYVRASREANKARPA